MNLSGLFKPLLYTITRIILFVSIFVSSFVFVFVLSFFFIYHVNPFQKKEKLSLKLSELKIKSKFFDFFRWILFDFLERNKHKFDFTEYGFTFYVGRQGYGKTISMVEYLRRMRERFPDCVIVSNFKCDFSDYIMVDWRDILNVRNGEKGVIFAIDEIHSEYSAASWKDVPENLLSEISQQRKQKVKIIASAQYFCRVAKPLREQAFTVVSCHTYFKRFTRCKIFDSELYSAAADSNKLGDIKPLKSYSFVQDDILRNCYDTYEKIKSMKKVKFIPRSER